MEEIGKMCDYKVDSYKLTPLGKAISKLNAAEKTIEKLQAELKQKYKGCCDDCFVVTEPQKENTKLKAKIKELEKEIAERGKKNGTKI